ncbi:SAVED domain-containing protein [Hyalangium sp.]|uniref:SAVED domain-containing protein n=1 Tax=Hyalangium sp. TaxID=2028555 RepID=UPI002D6FA148|nr:SAVED domain-containing protein [Hyalangium sp.]HYI01568.1 SAVED domain-containing protein [Hyalangium sp.]
MDIHIPINARTRALILRYEHDRPVIESAARDALIRSGLDGDRDVAATVLHPFDRDRLVRAQKPEDWAWAFHENERFADALLQKEAELGLDHLPVHLFGCAPLVLMLHLASCLQRRPLRVYQQANDGPWSLGYDRAQPPTPEDFFQVEGLPATRQGGRGHVLLVVEVTKPIKDKALATFQARHASDLLATVCLRPASREPSPMSVRDPSEVSRAVEQFRGVLDSLHERLGGATSVLLAMDCPSSFAAALATAINPNTQHPLWLHHFNPEQDSYLLVHQILHQRRGLPAQARSPSIEQFQEASHVLEQVTAVHQDLAAWLAGPEQRHYVALLGRELMESRIRPTPSREAAPVFRYLDGSWTFEVSLLQGLAKLRQRLGSKEDWEECIRVFLLHEAYHVRQGGPTSYSYRGSGRTGFVLEAVDFDADEVSFQAALAWRQSNRPATSKERTQALEAILWNAVEIGRVFEPEPPLRDIAERRLRRKLIWLFHACRLGTSIARRASTTELERVTVEIAGLPSQPDPYESYSQQRVRLEGLDPREQLDVAIYYRHRLARGMNTPWVMNLLQAISHWSEQPRDKAQGAVKDLFHEFFDRHRFLLEPEERDGAA